MSVFQMNEEELRDFRTLASEWRKDPYICIMKSFIQHGTITTYDHCLNVAAMAFWINRRWHLKADERVLVTGAILHDFFLYDWHGRDQGASHKAEALTACSERLKRLPDSKITGREIGVGPGDWTHSYKHPLIAGENAQKLFGVDLRTRKVIESHMWPYTFWRLPGSREAWIVSIADKYCSAKETLFCRRKGGRS